MNKITEGNRNTECHRIASYLAEKGVDWATIEYLMLGWAFTYTSPALSGMEVRQICASALQAGEAKRQAQSKAREYLTSGGEGWNAE